MSIIFMLNGEEPLVQWIIGAIIYERDSTYEHECFHFQSYQPLDCHAYSITIELSKLNAKTEANANKTWLLTNVSAAKTKSIRVRVLSFHLAPISLFIHLTS